jgi:hypothetical protein
MSDEATGFVGSIPKNYERGLGPIFFTDYAEHTARCVAAYGPLLVTGAGTHSHAVPAQPVAGDDEVDRDRPQPADARSPGRTAMDETRRNRTLTRLIL